MSNEKALVKSLEKSMSINSLKDLARVSKSENAILLVDVSGSMGAHMQNGKTRIQGLREVNAGIQSKRATTMIAFGLFPNRNADPTGLEQRTVGSEVDFITEIPEAQHSTPMAEAIDFARAHGFGRAVVISDGGPNDPHAAMEAAKRFGGQIDVIYVGDPGDPGSIFLDELAKATGGSRFEGDLSEVKNITGAVIGLLNGEVMEQEEEDENGDDDGDDEDEDDDDIVDADEDDE
jgi:hypothetical protein